MNDQPSNGEFQEIPPPPVPAGKRRRPDVRGMPGTANYRGSRTEIDYEELPKLRDPRAIVPGELDPGKPSNIITEELAAIVWIERGNGKSIQQIARSLNIVPQRVSAVLQLDADRLRAIIAIEQERRAAMWRQAEEQAVNLMMQMVGRVQGMFFNDDGTPKLGTDGKFIGMGSRWGQMVRQAATDASTRVQLLTGEATERLHTVAEGGGDPLADDALIQKAIDLGKIELLPPELKARAERMRSGTITDEDAPRPQIEE